MDMNQYIDVFIDESKENLQSMNDLLLELEKSPTDLDIVGEIFRAAHTLKGMSATMGFQDLANLTHKMENVLDGVRNQQIVVTSDILDVVFESVDDLEAMIQDIASGGNGKRDVSLVVHKLQDIEEGRYIANNSQNEVAAATQVHTKVENSFKRLDEFELSVLEESREQGYQNLHVYVQLRNDCLLKAARVYMVFDVLEQIGEIIKSNPSVEALEEEQFDYEFTVLLVTKETPEDVKQRILKVSEIDKVEVEIFNQDSFSKQKEEQFNPKEPSSSSGKDKESTEKSSTQKSQTTGKTIRVNIDRLDVLMNLFEELVIDRGRLEQISNELEHQGLHETVERMSRISGDLQSIILNMRMVPVDQVFNRFPRMVRQLAKDLHKQVNLEISGAETELDRTVIDEIGDPLVHLIRNALDHGIELPEERSRKGKLEEGMLSLRAYHSGNHVFIEIEDDGAGINREKVVQKAIHNGLVSKEQAQSLSDSQINELIMESGFSTAEKISDVSGRGVGLDVVKNTIESLGGSIFIESKLDKGSLFSIQLPLTLSIISVMLVEIQEEKFAIPLSSIIETAIVKKEEIMSAHHKKVIDFRGKVVPLVFLKDVFDIPTGDSEDSFFSIVIVRKGDKMAGLVVDSLIGQQEIVLKSLGNYLTNVFAISGATILGDGQVALIIDSNALIK
ncbi:chemotaxis protein CheA [Bacillaceae bacterium S4-13-58]